MIHHVSDFLHQRMLCLAKKFLRHKQEDKLKVMSLISTEDPYGFYPPCPIPQISLPLPQQPRPFRHSSPQPGFTNLSNFFIASTLGLTHRSPHSSFITHHSSLIHHCYENQISFPPLPGHHRLHPRRAHPLHPRHRPRPLGPRRRRHLVARLQLGRPLARLRGHGIPQLVLQHPPRHEGHPHARLPVLRRSLAPHPNPTPGLRRCL